MNKTIFLCLSLFWFGLFNGNGQVVINEVLSVNTSINTDEDGTYQDWVELYNAGIESVSLAGYGLSDDAAEPFKWVFPDVTLASGEFLLVWCSDKNRTAADAPLHTNFKISAEGETITLTATGGLTLDSFAVPLLPANVSYGRQEDGSATSAYFGSPTPNASNNTATGYDSILSEPAFSVAPGFYSEPFELSLSTSAEGAAIIYTLDGSEPDENNIGGTTYQYKISYQQFPDDLPGEMFEQHYTSNVYAEPIPIQDRTSESNKISLISTTYNFLPYYFPSTNIRKSTVVRAKAVRPGALPSPVKTCNYFVFPEGNPFTLPVVALNTNDDKLFDYEDGISVAGIDFDQWREANPLATVDGLSGANYTRSGMAGEIGVNISYFANGTQMMNQTAGIRIQGAQSRILPNKSMRLYARSEYGKSTLDQHFFADSPFDSFKRIILRNSGSDSYHTMFRDAFIQNSVKHMRFQTQRYQPSVLFINSEYWGLYNLRESYDEHYFERVFNIAEEDLDYLEGAGYAIETGSNEHYFAMLDFIAANPLSDPGNYAYVGTQMDIDNYTDYYIANIFASNVDWPHNNNEFWRKRTPGFIANAPYGHDGRWRWVLKDTDFAFGGSGNPDAVNVNTLEFASGQYGFNNTEWPNLLFRALLESENFKIGFINRFADMLNTTFLSARMIGIIEEMQSVIEPEIGNHIERWSHIGSIDNWQANVEVMKNFATLRPDIQRTQILEKFDLTGTVTAQLDADDTQGFIKINTIDITPETPGVPQNPYPWSGVYFSGIPVTLKAVARPGYAFSHWSGASSSTNAAITLIPDADFSITAHFTPSGSPDNRVPVFFWMIDNTIANDVPLTTIDASYEAAGQAVLEYQSAHDGYPFTAAHPLWRKASLERRNSPTEINYLPQANNNEAFADSNMRGLQVKQPFQSGDRENMMIFHMPTEGYKDILVAFAAKDENAAQAILVDYSVTEGAPVWTTSGLPMTTLPLSSSYQLYTADFSSIDEANHNPDFKVRLRFWGNNMTVDNGDRVTFNNISMTGVAEELGISDPEANVFTVYPNPASEKIYISNSDAMLAYKIYALDGRLVGAGNAVSEIDLSALVKGVYLLQLSSENRVETKKIVKK